MEERIHNIKFLENSGGSIASALMCLIFIALRRCCASNSMETAIIQRQGLNMILRGLKS
jgi:hypothetical protein